MPRCGRAFETASAQRLVIGMGCDDEQPLAPLIQRVLARGGTVRVVLRMPGRSLLRHESSLAF